MSTIYSVLIVELRDKLSLPVVQCLGQVPNLRLGILAPSSHKWIRFSRYLSFFRALPDTTEEAELVGAILNEIRRVGADILLPVDQTGIGVVARHARALSAETALPPLPEAQTLELVIDKWSMAQFMSTEDIPSPPTFLYEDSSDFHDRLHTLKFPVLAKPASGGGGYGIEYFEGPAELMDFLTNRVDGFKKYIIQDFIAGPAVDCSMLCRDGDILAHTIQAPLYTGLSGFSFARSIKFIQDPLALDTARKLVSKLRYSGVAHIDMQVCPNQGRPMILELNPRYWRTLLSSLTVGVNFPHLACLAALGSPVIQPHYQLAKIAHFRDLFEIGIGKLCGRKNTQLNFDHTNLSHIMRDPLPSIMNWIIR